VHISSGGDLNISPGSVITGGDHYSYPMSRNAHGYDQRRNARPEYVAWGYDHWRNSRPNALVRLIGKIGGGLSRRRRTAR